MCNFYFKICCLRNFFCGLKVGILPVKTPFPKKKFRYFFPNFGMFANIREHCLGTFANIREHCSRTFANIFANIFQCLDKNTAFVSSFERGGERGVCME